MTDSLSRIAQKGTKLYRYDLIRPPMNWSPRFKSPIYIFDDIGPKNAVGFYFFFASRDETLLVGNNVLKEKNAYSELWLTETSITKDINMLDLSKCHNVVDLYVDLWKYGIDIFTDSFYQIVAYRASQPLSRIRAQVENIAKLGCDKMKVSECEFDIWKFAYGADETEKLRYALQQLTDFDNGFVFKELLISRGLDGYIFRETDTETFALIDSSSLSKPTHTKLAN